MYVAPHLTLYPPRHPFQVALEAQQSHGDDDDHMTPGCSPPFHLLFVGIQSLLEGVKKMFGLGGHKSG